MNAGSSDSDIVGKDAGKWPTAVAGFAGSKRRAMVQRGWPNFSTLALAILVSII